MSTIVYGISRCWQRVTFGQKEASPSRVRLYIAENVDLLGPGGEAPRRTHQSVPSYHQKGAYAFMTQSSGNNSPYVIDIEQPAETARLVEQSKLFTSAMGGLFPDELDMSRIRSVLDLGCGPGEWANQVAFEYPRINVVGIDINEIMIQYATAFARVQGRPNISFEVMNITHPLAFADASFDLINARFIVGFQDTASWPVLLAECRRVLTQGEYVRSVTWQKLRRNPRP